MAEPYVDMAVMTFDQCLCLPCDVDEPVCSGKRAIDSNECAICEPCAPSKMPKLCPSEEDDDDFADAEDAGGTALDTPDSDPVQKASRICVTDGCGKRTSWGLIDGARYSAFLCSLHGKAHGGCEKVDGKRCAATPCKRKPNFGKPGGLPKTATHCSEHKLEGYVDLVSKLCENPNCDIIASFDKRGGKRARCETHSEENDIDLVNKLCENPNCDDRAIFGKRGGKPARCKTHIEENDIDLVHKLCENPNCDIIASFGKRGGKRARCETHSEENDIDLVNKLCENPNCDDRALYGKRGGTPARCGEHSEENDIDLVNKLCENPNCDERALYGVEGGRRQYCSRHRDREKHINVHNKRCHTCTLPPYKYPHPKSTTRQCTECDPQYKGPRTKQKEEAMKVELDAAFPNMTIMREYVVDFCGDGADRTKCGQKPAMRARCDFLLQSDDKIVVVEVDEDAHRHYCPPNEITRVNDIYTAFLKGDNLKNRHVHFVRFNPDAFKIGFKSANVSLLTRYATLVEVVRAALAPSSEERAWSLRHMYYDCDAKGRLRIMDEIDEHIRPLVDAPIYNTL